MILSLEREKTPGKTVNDSGRTKYQCDPNRSYLIVGKISTVRGRCHRFSVGLKNNARFSFFFCFPRTITLGSKYSTWIDLVEWLVIRGARKIVVAIKKYAMSTTASRRYVFVSIANHKPGLETNVFFGFFLLLIR